MKKKVYLVALLLISCFTLFGFGLKANAGELGYKDGIYKLNGIGESTNLIKKYEGAEITLVSSTASYSTKFVNGGVNSFASTRAGMERLRTDLSYTARFINHNIKPLFLFFYKKILSFFKNIITYICIYTNNKKVIQLM